MLVADHYNYMQRVAISSTWYTKYSHYESSIEKNTVLVTCNPETKTHASNHSSTLQ